MSSSACAAERATQGGSICACAGDVFCAKLSSAVGELPPPARRQGGKPVAVGITARPVSSGRRARTRTLLRVLQSIAAICRSLAMCLRPRTFVFRWRPPRAGELCRRKSDSVISRTPSCAEVATIMGYAHERLVAASLRRSCQPVDPLKVIGHFLIAVASMGSFIEFEFSEQSRDLLFGC